MTEHISNVKKILKTEKKEIERMRKKPTKYKLVELDQDFLAIIPIQSKKAQIKDRIFEACHNLKYFKGVSFEFEVQFVRNIVNIFNRENGTDIRVSKDDGKSYIYYDIMKLGLINKLEYDSILDDMIVFLESRLCDE